MLAVRQLLSDDGELSLIIPADHMSRLEAEAALAGLFKTRQCAVRTTPRKQPKRYLLAYAKHPAETMEQTEEVLEELPGVRSPWYTALTKDFYIK
jgi:tRNA1Val (adenine37-N6)-methyltransferase